MESDRELPEALKITEISKKYLKTKISTLREEYFQKGWNIWQTKGIINFLNISKSNINDSVPILQNCLDYDVKFIESSFSWGDNAYDKNILAFALFSTLRFNVLFNSNFDPRVQINNKPVPKREFFYQDAIEYISEIPIYEGINYSPCLISDNGKFYPAYLINRVIRAASKIRGSPGKMQTIANINTAKYFQKIKDIFCQTYDKSFGLCLGNFIFDLNENLIELNLKIEKYEKIQKKPNRGVLLYYSPRPKSKNNLVKKEHSSIENLGNGSSTQHIFNEFIDYTFPIIPRNLSVCKINESPLSVGGGQKRPNYTQMFLLDQFGPFKKVSKTLILVPIFPQDQLEIQDSIDEIANGLIDGLSSYNLRFRGVRETFELKVEKTQPFHLPIALNIPRIDFINRINEIFSKIKEKYSQCSLRYDKIAEILPFFLVGLKDEAKISIGEFTPKYCLLKKNLTSLSIPNQIITKFNTFLNNDWKIFPFWNLASSVFAKINGIPWVADSRTDKNNNPIHAIVGLRFAKIFNKDESGKYVLGVTTIFTGNGRYVGYKTQQLDYDLDRENYDNYCRSKSLVKVKGIKLSKDEVELIFQQIINFLNSNLDIQNKPGSIIFHRLGIISNEEAIAFKECFQKSPYSFALVTISNISMRYRNAKNKDSDVERGFFLKFSEKEGLLYTQGYSDYKATDNSSKEYKPRSCPIAFKIKLITDTGVYNNIVEAADDIFTLTRMNWRHAVYSPSNYPVSLQYALDIAQNYKNEIIPVGDYNETPWFL